MTQEALLAIPNISEGRDQAAIAYVAGDDVVDVSSDPDHNRSVLTYAGPHVVDSCVAMIDRAVASLDITKHVGVHPRFGVVDVLPFVGPGAQQAADEIIWKIYEGPGVPTFRYGSHDLPALRRRLRNDLGEVHPTAGVICVGVRTPLVAFNVNLRGTMEEARSIAREIRSPEIRALAFELASRRLVQVSMNLLEPSRVGPRDAYERIAADIVDCEVVGLVPNGVRIDGLPWREPVRSVGEALRMS